MAEKEKEVAKTIFYPNWFNVTLTLIVFFSANTGTSIILSTVIAYLLSSILFIVIKGLIKIIKIAITVGLIILIFISPMGEKIINNTVNKPDYVCQAAADCSPNGYPGRCEVSFCTSKEWKPYESKIGKWYRSLPFAKMFCKTTQEPICTCESSMCKTYQAVNVTNEGICLNVSQDKKELCSSYVVANKY